MWCGFRDVNRLDNLSQSIVFILLNKAIVINSRIKKALDVRAVRIYPSQANRTNLSIKQAIECRERSKCNPYPVLNMQKKKKKIQRRCMDERGKSTLSIVVQSSVGKRGHMQQLVTPPSLGSVPSRPVPSSIRSSSYAPLPG